MESNSGWQAIRSFAEDATLAGADGWLGAAGEAWLGTADSSEVSAVSS